MKQYTGILEIENKIWFNDAETNSCRLRLCGFTKKQIEKLKEAEFIDITLTKIDEDGMKIEGLMMIV